MKRIFVLTIAGCMGVAVFSGCATSGSNGELESVAASTVGTMAAGNSTVNVLLGQLDSDNVLVRIGAMQGIAKLGSKGAQAVPALIPFLSSPDANVRKNAAYALGQIGPKASDAIPDLVNLIKDSNPSVQSTAVEAIANIGGANVPSLLVPLLISANPTVQKSAMSLLGKFGPASQVAIPQLVSLAQGNKNLRSTALDTLVAIGPNSVAALTPLLLSTDADLVSQVTAALSLLKK